MKEDFSRNFFFNTVHAVKGLSIEMKITTECVLCNYIRCFALIGKYIMRKLYIVLCVINKSVYLTVISKITSI